MHLAILLTNTDESAFAQLFPKDGEKFTSLIQIARPSWTTDVFSVKDGVFPADLSPFDGVIITGSPTSVHCGAAWVDQLLDLIRQMVSDGMPLFGACFGHQAIALACDGTVEQNPDGWVHGLTQNHLRLRPEWAAGLPETVHLYGSHSEQVTRVPEIGKIWTSCPGCPASGILIGDRVMTTQHHPEMSPAFIRALTDEMSDVLDAETTKQALQSLSHPADQKQFAESLARFFESALNA